MGKKSVISIQFCQELQSKYQTDLSQKFHVIQITSYSQGASIKKKYEVRIR